MLRIPHCLDNRLIDGGKVVRPTQPPHFSQDSSCLDWDSNRVLSTDFTRAVTCSGVNRMEVCQHRIQWQASVTYFLFLWVASCCVYYYNIFWVPSIATVFFKCFHYYYYIPATCFSTYVPSSGGIYILVINNNNKNKNNGSVVEKYLLRK
jgi:hypothetical protein